MARKAMASVVAARSPSLLQNDVVSQVIILQLPSETAAGLDIDGTVGISAAVEL